MKLDSQILSYSSSKLSKKSEYSEEGVGIKTGTPLIWIENNWSSISKQKNVSSLNEKKCFMKVKIEP